MEKLHTCDPSSEILQPVELEVAKEIQETPAHLKDFRGILAGIVEIEKIVDVKDRPKTNDWTREDFLNYGNQIIKLLNGHQFDHPGKKPLKINTEVLRRANHVGLGPRPKLIAKEFGGLSNFYTELGIAKSHRIGTFNDWTRDDFIKYFRRVGLRTGKRPSFAVLNKLALRNPSNPSPSMLVSRFGQLGIIAELAGFPDVNSWNIQDYTDWGVKYMDANDGLQPSARYLNYLSKKGLGPSSSAVVSNFGKIRSYQEPVTAQYIKMLENKENEKKALFAAILDGQKSKKIPDNLFGDCLDEDTKIIRYARYAVLDDLLKDVVRVEKKVTISKDTNRVNIGSEIKKSRPSITDGDIEHSALVLGVFDILWPLDSHLQTLKIPENLLTPSALGNIKRITVPKK